MQHTYSERNPELSSSGGDDMSLHDDASPHVTVQSSYSVNLESLDNVIANEHCKKVHSFFLFKSDNIQTFRVVQVKASTLNKSCGTDAYIHDK